MMWKGLVLYFLTLFFSWAATAQPVRDTIPPERDAYQHRIMQETLHGVYIPRDLQDVFAQLNELMEPGTRQRFRDMPEDELEKMNTTLGQWIRVNWGFYDGSRLTAYLNQYNVSWPEDMSELIIITYHRYLNQKPLGIKELVDHYTEKKYNYWMKRVVTEDDQ